jgi:hypothetical protein
LAAFLGFLLTPSQIAMSESSLRVFKSRLRTFGSAAREPAGKSQKNKKRSGYGLVLPLAFVPPKGTPPGWPGSAVTMVRWNA